MSVCCASRLPAFAPHPAIVLSAIVALAEEQRKKALVAELETLQTVVKVSTLDSARLKRSVAERLAGTKALLARNPAQARRALKELLEDRIAVEPVKQGGNRAVRFTGKGTFGRLLTGEAAPLMVVPPG